jgi:hypothetical protein
MPAASEGINRAAGKAQETQKESRGEVVIKSVNNFPLLPHVCFCKHSCLAEAACKKVFRFFAFSVPLIADHRDLQSFVSFLSKDLLKGFWERLELGRGSKIRLKDLRTHLDILNMAVGRPVEILAIASRADKGGLGLHRTGDKLVAPIS